MTLTERARELAREAVTGARNVELDELSKAGMKACKNVERALLTFGAEVSNETRAAPWDKDIAAELREAAKR